MVVACPVGVCRGSSPRAGTIGRTEADTTEREKQMTVDDLTEREAEIMFYEMRRRFGWQGVIFTRRDAVDVWATMYENEVTYDDLGDPHITDEQWNKVAGSDLWNQVSDVMDCEGLLMIRHAVLSSREDNTN